jgi:monofunctional biosynthetic peptidoglycan transglycosylase
MDAAADAMPSNATNAGSVSAGRSRRRGCFWLAAAFVVAYLTWEAVTWPDVAWVAGHDPKSSAFLDRYRERAAAEGLPAPRQRWASYGRISNNLKHAVIAAEDMEFFSHDGFSRHELEASLKDAWEDRELPRGASTLTQQLAKNLWLSPSYNPLRKVKEAALTWELEHYLGKRRILELYLNFAEFGPGVYGADAAAHRYFGTSAAGLSPNQAAQLAAGLSRPSSWHPGAGTRGYQRRVRLVQRRMAIARWILHEL